MERNPLYPVFLKPHELTLLLVGGGYVAEEKLSFLLKSSPDARVVMVAPWMRDGTLQVAQTGNVTILQEAFRPEHLNGKDWVIVATDDEALNKEIYAICREKHLLVNVADNPPLCDFYMGGIVTKGNLKIGISTNGKSPTLAKRIRELLEEVIPENIDELLQNLNTYRATIRGDFEKKVNQLNQLTKSWLSKTDIEKDTPPDQK